MTVKTIFKTIFTKVISAVIAFGGDYFIHELLGKEGVISESGKLIVLIFFFIILYHITEWIIFSFFEWTTFEKEFSKMKKDNDSFYAEWKTFLSEMNENKKILMEIQQSKSRTGIILDKFAKSNMIVDSISSKISDDLELDEYITKDKDQKEFHDFIASLKYDDFFASHFICKGKEKEVLQIPSYYFKNYIWKEFVDKAYCYYSIQLLDDIQAKIYLRDKNRMQAEINHLDNKSKEKINKTEIKKLFVVDEANFQINNKLKDGLIKNYLKCWDNDLKDTYKEMPIKIIKKKHAIGLVSQTGSKLNDIGIFGDVYGIQSINNLVDGKFYIDELKINFYFDKNKTNEQKVNFQKLMDKSIMLNEIL